MPREENPLAQTQPQTHRHHPAMRHFTLRFALRFGDLPDDVASATKFALRSIARRYRSLSEEIRGLDDHLARVVTETAPALVAVHGVGIDTAATLLVAVGQDLKRLKSEAAFAHMCGVAPIPASSGKVVRHRLNRRGSHDERTRAYAERRTAEGKSKRETMRCLKRYIARELYGVLVSTVVPTTPLSAP